MNKQPVLEIVLFKTKPGIAPAEVIASAEKLAPVLRQMEGFLRRHLCANADGWVDVVYWRDLAAAQAASRAIMQIPACQPFFSLIDTREITMLHFEAVLEQQCE